MVRVCVVLWIFALVSCQTNKTPKKENFKAEKSRVYNPTKGYKTDPIHRKPINLLINNNDTLVTGIPLKLDPVVTSIDTMKTPKVIRLSQPVLNENNTLTSIAFNSELAKSKILDSSKLNKIKLRFNKADRDL
jgi:hypothetical protein